MPKTHPISSHKRIIYIIVFSIFLFLLLFSVSTIPFIWESKSLWYKLGLDRTYLLAGKVAGLCAAVLLLVQIIFVLRIRLLDKIFGLDRLYVMHQVNGFIIVGLGTVHAALILIPEGFDNLPIGWKFWPEIIGALLFTTLVSVVVSAKLRNRFIPHHIWRALHRPLGYFLVAILPIHVLFVSDSFKENIPKFLFLFLIFITILIISISKKKQYESSKKRYKIEEIDFPTETNVSLKITVPHSFNFLPGQFILLRIFDKNVSAEPHPFTIASSPEEKGTLRLIIKKCGDWTNRLDNASDAQASLEGPFGLFSYTTKRRSQSLVFIAAGIGITPFLSMLNQLAAEKQKPAVKLIWSLRYKSEMFLQDELNFFRKQIPDFTVQLVFTRENNGERLTKSSLKNFLKDVHMDSHLLLCGPDLMMKSTKKNLRSLGFPAKNIYYEKFSL